MHLIHKHRFDIQVHKRQHALALHHELGDVMKDTFYPNLEKLLNRFDSGKDVKVIEQLSVELPDINYINWKSHLVEKLLLHIEAYLKEHILWEENTVDKNESLADIQSNERYAELILFEFLRTGILSPNVLAENIELLSVHVIVDESFVVALKILFEGEPQHILRFVTSLPQEFVALAIKMMKGTSTEILLIRRFVELANFGELNKKQVENLVVLFVVVFTGKVAIEQYAVQLQRLLKQYFQISFSGESISKLELLLLPRNDKPAEFSEMAVLEKTIQWIVTSNTNSSQIEVQENAENETDQLIMQIKDTAVIEEKMASVIHRESIHINNAGLVLLHPFLQQLFAQLNYLDEEKNIKPAFIHHAVCLSQHLVTYNEEMFEHDLVLNKILCGLAPEYVINTNIQFSENEKDLCDQLLKAVIKHWAILKNTSVEGLQQTFIQRKGRLFTGDDGLTLQIEENATDILLDHLPWSISVIYLPWMKNPVHVLWH